MPSLIPSRIDSGIDVSESHCVHRIEIEKAA
jgi:hypothetical protein